MKDEANSNALGLDPIDEKVTKLRTASAKVATKPVITQAMLLDLSDKENARNRAANAVKEAKLELKKLLLHGARVQEGPFTVRLDGWGTAGH